MLKYFSEVKLNNQIYSCDMVRISFCTNKSRAMELEYFINFECAYRTDVNISPIDTRSFRHKYFVQFMYDDESSMKCGFGLNGVKSEDNYRGFVEFNPNKVGEFSQFREDFAFLRERFGDYDVTRVDIAVDLVGVMRDKVFLRKDNRRYKLDAASKTDKTEYLGTRNAVGRVKVYNKTLESNLDYPLTRIEITTEPTLDGFRSHIPRVYDFSVSVQQKMFSSLNSTDETLLVVFYNAIVENIDNGMMLFNRLSRVKRNKLEPFLLPEDTLVKFDDDCVKQIFDNIRNNFRLNF